MRTGLEKYLSPDRNDLSHLSMCCCVSSTWAIASLCDRLYDASLEPLTAAEIEMVAFEVIFHLAGIMNGMARTIEREALELITEGAYERQ